MKLKGAILGFGNIAELGHWPTYSNSAEAEIVAVMDPSSKRQKAAKALGLRVYATPEDLFQKEKLDFVDICTPPSLHAELVLEALENQCHVLCEKPLALKVSDYEALAK